jgi:two-component system sensor histidine kinase KdpD
MWKRSCGASADLSGRWTGLRQSGGQPQRASLAGRGKLLAAGITIVGSVNIQYIEDQREAVEKLTGQRVTQSIPREFLNTADEIVIVDAPTETAPERRTALRELALVLSAEVIDAGLQRYLHDHKIEQSWGTHERFLICLSPRANFERMIATARRNASRFHCDVLAGIREAA